MIEKLNVENIYPDNFIDHLVIYGANHLTIEVKKEFDRLQEEIVELEMNSKDDIEKMENNLIQMVRYESILLELNKYTDIVEVLKGKKDKKFMPLKLRSK